MTSAIPGFSEIAVFWAIFVFLDFALINTILAKIKTNNKSDIVKSISERYTSQADIMF